MAFPGGSPEVYPRVGGGNARLKANLTGIPGLSPRGRGKRQDGLGDIYAPGSIPAWAGETRRPPLGHISAPVYPRVGGGNRRRWVGLAQVAGLSPRGRGKRSQDRIQGAERGSIPAWAGETEGSGQWQSIGKVYPRVGGGNYSRGRPCARTSGLSPRGRGKRHYDGQRPDGRRSIPAWAGETHRLLALSGYGRVYPRVGGGNSPNPFCALNAVGLSPRGRGKLKQQLCPLVLRRVYPRVGGGNGAHYRARE